MPPLPPLENNLVSYPIARRLKRSGWKAKTQNRWQDVDDCKHQKCEPHINTAGYGTLLYRNGTAFGYPAPLLGEILKKLQNGCAMVKINGRYAANLGTLIFFDSNPANAAAKLWMASKGRRKFR